MEMNGVHVLHWVAYILSWHARRLLTSHVHSIVGNVKCSYYKPVCVSVYEAYIKGNSSLIEIYVCTVQCTHFLSVCTAYTCNMLQYVFPQANIALSILVMWRYKMVIHSHCSYSIYVTICTRHKMCHRHM